ncbi:mannosyltransferase family protein [Psychromonas sp. Urea-02u-13]|uniref:mannosyltransferase family protein n=1 Tax=Psychromonas sp. Urea-02u-13 TaxID=2058326 RepID=UPI001E3D03F3|nr:mannosyltransferase family protein [Psychromonas sp. Urea-02u-13]
MNDSKRSLYDAFTDTWYRWDSVHYMKLAVEGYASEGQDRFLLVFYPLYPLLIHIMMYVIPDAFWTGLAVSNICLILACFTLFKIMMFEFHDESLAWKAVKYLLIYPFSFFTAIVYTESLFMLMSLSCFYFMRKGDFGWQEFMDCLPRSRGIMLCCYWRQCFTK